MANIIMIDNNTKPNTDNTIKEDIIKGKNNGTINNGTTITQ